MRSDDGQIATWDPDVPIQQLIDAGEYRLVVGTMDHLDVGTYELELLNTPESEIPVNLVTDEKGHAVIDGQLTQPGQNRQFNLHLPRSGFVNLNFLHQEGGPDPAVQLYDGESQLLEANDDCAGTINSHISPRLDGGNYLISVGSFNNEQTGSFQIDIKIDFEGDVDGDGIVADFLVLSENFGNKSTPFGPTVISTTMAKLNSPTS